MNPLIKFLLNIIYTALGIIVVFIGLIYILPIINEDLDILDSDNKPLSASKELNKTDKNTYEEATRVLYFGEEEYYKYDRNRIFAVKVSGSMLSHTAELNAFGKRKVHTNGKMTYVYFYNSKDELPPISVMSGTRPLYDVIDYINDNNSTKPVAEYYKMPNGEDGLNILTGND